MKWSDMPGVPTPAHGVGLMKILTWGMLHQHSIRCDLKRLELRVAGMSEMLESR